MLSIIDLCSVARARVKDAESLLVAKRYDGAAYLCGYAIEVALKARICRNMKWADFPEKQTEWQPHHQFLKVHNLGNLLKWSGREDLILNPPHAANWSLVRIWTPEDRYKMIGTMQPLSAEAIVSATKALVRVLLPRA